MNLSGNNSLYQIAKKTLPELTDRVRVTLTIWLALAIGKVGFIVLLVYGWFQRHYLF